MTKASCGTADDPEIFFPSHGNTINTAAARKAKQYCVECPVKAECLDQAQPHGIWGGLTAVERSHMAATDDVVQIPTQYQARRTVNTL